MRIDSLHVAGKTYSPHSRRSTDSCPTLPMAKLIFTILVIASANAVSAQQQTGNANASRDTGATSVMDVSSNLPEGPVGKDDLIGISVYDAPELTRSVRVDSDGTIRLPMLPKHIQAAGLTPEGLERSIRVALIEEQLLVDPIVTVSVLEYRSRPINVIGEVRTPITFQAAGAVTLMDAISRAGGLTQNAGSEILITSPEPGANSNSKK